MRVPGDSVTGKLERHREVSPRVSEMRKSGLERGDILLKLELVSHSDRARNNTEISQPL